mgnify:CR=1 FL=1
MSDSVLGERSEGLPQNDMIMSHCLSYDHKPWVESTVYGLPPDRKLFAKANAGEGLCPGHRPSNVAPFGEGCSGLGPGLHRVGDTLPDLSESRLLAGWG